LHVRHAELEHRAGAVASDGWSDPGATDLVVGEWRIQRQRPSALKFADGGGQPVEPAFALRNAATGGSESLVAASRHLHVSSCFILRQPSTSPSRLTPNNAAPMNAGARCQGFMYPSTKCVPMAQPKPAIPASAIA